MTNGGLSPPHHSEEVFSLFAIQRNAIERFTSAKNRRTDVAKWKPVNTPLWLLLVEVGAQFITCCHAGRLLAGRPFVGRPTQASSSPISSLPAPRNVLLADCLLVDSLIVTPYSHSMLLWPTLPLTRRPMLPPMGAMTLAVLISITSILFP